MNGLQIFGMLLMVVSLTKIITYGIRNENAEGRKELTNEEKTARNTKILVNWLVVMPIVVGIIIAIIYVNN